MAKSKLGGNKNGLGFYELMTAPKSTYEHALAAIEKNDFAKFYEMLGLEKPKSFEGKTFMQQKIKRGERNGKKENSKVSYKQKW